MTLKPIPNPDPDPDPSKDDGVKISFAFVVEAASSWRDFLPAFVVAGFATFAFTACGGGFAEIGGRETGAAGISVIVMTGVDSASSRVLGPGTGSEGGMSSGRRKEELGDGLMNVFFGGTSDFAGCLSAAASGDASGI